MKLVASARGPEGQTSAKKADTNRLSAGDAEQRLKRVTGVLEDYKALDLLVISLEGKAGFADFLVIASGTSTRHVSSMGSALEAKLGKDILGVEGLREGEWVCADMGDIVVHLFLPEKRRIYNLEKLWSHVFDVADQ